MHNGAMSPSELDTKAPSVPPRTCTCRNEYETCSACTEPKTVAPGIAAWLKNSKGEKFEVPKPEDAVNHPNHYTAGTLETIDAIEAMVGQAGWSPATGYRLGNVLKYLWRHAAKGGVESLKKARWYLDREIEQQEAEKKS